MKFVNEKVEFGRPLTKKPKSPPKRPAKVPALTLFPFFPRKYPIIVQIAKLIKKAMKCIKKRYLKVS